eukprot:s3772_g3.t3
MCINYLQEGWVQYFGHPKCLRLDPAGAFRSHAIEDWCDKHNIFLDIVPGEAHWKIGTVENAIKGLKEVMQKLRQMKLGDSYLLVMRHRPCYDYQPGELVFYWRCQGANKGRRQPGGKHGRFLGPARVLAVESRKEPDGTLRPGGAIWLVKGRNLLKCSPEQLRRASQREELVEALTESHNQQTPWTFQTVAQQIGGNRYEDISAQPDPSEWHRAQQPEEEVQPARRRIRSKRGPEQQAAPEDEEMELPDPNEAAELQLARALYVEARKQPLPLRTRGHGGAMSQAPTGLPRRPVSGLLYQTAREAETRHGEIWVKNFVAAKAFELIPDHLKPSKDQAIGMRWILTWKLKEDGTRKPKARAVLLGYQDGSYEHRSTTSPVMTRQTRQLVLQMAAWQRWKVQKGDVTGAFLQSRQYPDNLYCIPCPEICEALGVDAGTITKVTRSTVETIIQSNILLSHAKAKQNYLMKIHAFRPEDDLVFIGWVDAANGNRSDGGSTQGIFIGATPKEMLQGDICGVSPISWTSQKIDRACRSPGAAEAQAAVNGEDSLFAVRYQWSELMYGPPNLQDPAATVAKTAGCLVTDSRNVYDKLETEVLVVKGAEKRTSIELLSLKEAQLQTGLLVRWVHSEAQLANSLTKHGGQREYDLYFKMRHRWRLVEDASMMSAKRRKDCGLQPLEQSCGKSETKHEQEWEKWRREMLEEPDAEPSALRSAHSWGEEPESEHGYQRPAPDSWGQAAALEPGRVSPAAITAKGATAAKAVATAPWHQTSREQAGAKGRAAKAKAGKGQRGGKGSGPKWNVWRPGAARGNARQKDSSEQESGGSRSGNKGQKWNVWKPSGNGSGEDAAQDDRGRGGSKGQKWNIWKSSADDGQGEDGDQDDRGRGGSKNWNSWNSSTSSWNKWDDWQSNTGNKKKEWWDNRGQDQGEDSGGGWWRANDSKRDWR